MKLKIVHIEAKEYGTLVAELSNGYRYSVFLREAFEYDPRFPKSLRLWQQAGIDVLGRTVTWANGFRVNAEMLVALAYYIKPVPSQPQQQPICTAI